LSTVLGTGQHAAQQLSIAAADGKLQTIKGLVWAGVPVDARNRAEGTALNTSCLAPSHPEVTRFLISKGADINLAPACLQSH
jgi:hypothetical protein